MSPKSFRVLGVVMLATAALTAIALPRIASPQAASEETIGGTISTTRIITQNARLTGNVTCTVDSAPCIQFGSPGLRLNLNGFTVTGLADASTSCKGSQVGNVAGTANEDGIFAIGQADTTVAGPGLVQRFRAAGVDLRNSDRSLVANVTAATNCNSGILIGDSTDVHIEANVAVRNGTTEFPCGGI